MCFLDEKHGKHKQLHLTFEKNDGFTVQSLVGGGLCGLKMDTVVFGVVMVDFETM